MGRWVLGRGEKLSLKGILHSWGCSDPSAFQLCMCLPILGPPEPLATREQLVSAPSGFLKVICQRTEKPSQGPSNRAWDRQLGGVINPNRPSQPVQ